ncbi:MAG: PEP-CTERM sorting domain-containing protein [Planctomycetota bacterium]
MNPRYRTMSLLTAGFAVAAVAGAAQAQVTVFEDFAAPDTLTPDPDTFLADFGVFTFSIGGSGSSGGSQDTADPPPAPAVGDTGVGIDPWPFTPAGNDPSGDGLDDPTFVYEVTVANDSATSGGVALGAVTSWTERLPALAGVPQTGNLITTDSSQGFFGFYVKYDSTEAAAIDLEVALWVDDSAGGLEVSNLIPVVGDGTFQLVEFDLSDPDLFNVGFGTSDGVLEPGPITLDSIVLYNFGPENDELGTVEIAYVHFDPTTPLVDLVPDVSFLEADFNQDGVVDLLDFDTLASNFGGPGDETSGDATGDGVVDLLDFDVLASQFGQSSPAAVPEPASLALLGLGGLAAMRRRRA